MQLFAALLLLVLFGVKVDAIIPLPCANPVSFDERRCCPVPSVQEGVLDAGPCGSKLNPPRGVCRAIAISNSEFDANRADVREKWPLQYFNSTCVCEERYGGVDCGECSYAYNDGTPECNTKTIHPRKSAVNMTESDWTNYREALRTVKLTPARYMVATATFTEDWRSSLVHPTTYNLLIWMHHVAAKDNERTLVLGDLVDFAHEGTGFPTWHRLFLLWFEREIQVAIGDHLFRLPYWDWRDPEQREILFTEKRLGENALGNVRGDIFGDLGQEWMTVCWEDPSSQDQDNPIPICNPTVPSGQGLRRCPIKSLCDKDNENWPSYDDVEKAVSIYNYDYPPYDRFVRGEDNSFRNYFEGFVAEPGSNCEDDTLCTIQKNGTSETTITVSRRLHNTGHIILGLGDLKAGPHIPFEHVGVMSCVAASPNDPAFVSHHAMVDCVLEEWLQRNKDRLSTSITYPESDQIREGHRADNYLVPLMPLYTNRDLFKTSDNFGYSCPRFSAATFNTYGTVFMVFVLVSILVNI